MTTSEVRALLVELLGGKTEDFQDVVAWSGGMTNQSFLFTWYSKRYILRVPGSLGRQEQEFKVYQTLKDLQICEPVIYWQHGYKIAEFIPGARNCQADNWEEVSACIGLLKQVHQSNLKVTWGFDLYQEINFYETLMRGNPYPDYVATKQRVWGLRDLIQQYQKPAVLCHLDAHPDNFVLGKRWYLIDWEYAAMQDPDLDLAMFALYAGYDLAMLNALIATYYPEGCAREVRWKIYAYLATAGLLWSNWAVASGQDLGEYGQRQYRYAQEYSQLVTDILERKVKCQE
ncbi:choline kinase family protein [Ligilactobacillus equi]|uniref:phosphotransferase n=1 Tax=Ligilactobacillus equi TaxID=137357 RepID=UPI002ED4D174